MSSYLKSPSEREWTAYAVIMLLILFIGAVSQALLVPPAWQPKENQSQTQKLVAQNPIPPATSPSPHSREAVEPKRLESEQPVANASSPSHTKQNDVCGVWVSATSQKQ